MISTIRFFVGRGDVKSKSLPCIPTCGRIDEGGISLAGANRLQSEFGLLNEVDFGQSAGQVLDCLGQPFWSLRRFD